MKKAFLFLALAGVFIATSRAAVRQDSDTKIGPAVVTTTTTVAAGGTAKINCIEYLVGYSTANYTVRVLDGGTTIYASSRLASIPHYVVFGFTPVCGSTNTAMTLQCTGDTDTGAAMQLNYNGFVYKKNQ